LLKLALPCARVSDVSKREQDTSLTRGIFRDARQGPTVVAADEESFIKFCGAISVDSTALIGALGRVDDPNAKTLAREVEERLGGSEDLIIAAWPSGHEQRKRMNGLVESLMPDEIPQPVELLQARRSAQMRRDMLMYFGYFSAEDLADMHGSAAKNRYALAARWAREGRVFGVPLGARNVFPAFQFNAEGVPYPVVAQALAALPREDMSPWAVGLWWYANNASLPGEARPAELIGTQDQERIIGAAARLAQPLPL
jgi:hypothetical protein